MDLPTPPSILSMPPHCHRALHLRCSKVTGSVSPICQLMILLLPQQNAISVLKIKYIIFNWKDYYPSRSVPVQVTKRNVSNRIPEE